MKCLNRNLQTFHYALYEGRKPIKDEWGNDTSEWEVLYGEPIQAKANISAAKGETQTSQFGESEQYDKVLVFTDTLPIDEYSILWVDTVPLHHEEYGYSPHDYIVKKVAHSLNSTSIAITKVSVSNE